MGDGYIALAAAIIEQTIKDYKAALRMKESKKKDKRIADCEGFLMSEWGQQLTHGNGDLILQRCRSEVAQEKNKKHKKKKEKRTKCLKSNG